jgi:hypothetical protein
MEPEPEIEDTPVPTPTTESLVEPEEEEPEEEPPAEDAGPGPLDLALALGATLVVSSAGYYVLRLYNEPMNIALRAALGCLLGGLVVYLAYVFRMPGAIWLRQQSGVWAAGWITLFGSFVPLAIAWIAVRRRRTT